MQSVHQTTTKVEATLKLMENPWKSDRLTYRALENTEEDKKYTHEFLNNDPHVLAKCWHVTYRPQSRKETDEYLEESMKDCLMAVMICISNTSDEKSTLNNVPIGVLELSGPRITTSHHRETSLVISIAAEHRGKGYGSEAINWALDWAFTHGAQHRVTLWVAEHNVDALRLYKRMGFVQEGAQREALWFGRRWWDDYMFGMLESDWAKLRGLTE